MMRFYDYHGNTCTMEQWQKLFANRVVANSTVEHPLGNVEVSTIYLGLDHSVMSDQPIVFETMAFPQDLANDFQRRYSTLEEAVKGHKHSLGLIKEILDQKQIRAKSAATRERNLKNARTKKG